MTFTESDLNVLSQFEDYFDTAVRADWTRNPGRENLRIIYDIFTKATGDTRRLNDGCQHCILELIRDCGRRYFADKHNDARFVELTEQEMNAPKKVKVATAKSKRVS